MLKNKSKRQSLVSFNSQPRKRRKLDPATDSNYNQFQGGFIQNIEEERQLQGQNKKDSLTAKQLPFAQEEVKYKNIYNQVVHNMNGSNGKHKFRKIADVDKKQQEKVKIQESAVKQLKIQQQKQPVKPKSKANQAKAVANTNWQSFLSKANDKKQTVGRFGSSQKKQVQNFVAIDCQFVKCGQVDSLARISIVSQTGDKLYDSYVKPDKKITDYVTSISGITYAHIKNAPSFQKAISQAKKKLLNKIVVGHTIQKDLQVCGLTDWKGMKAKVDISLASFFRNGKKLTSLKDLSLKYLGKTIQEGWHSSVQDAQMTMKLFKLKQKQILKQMKMI